MFENSTAHTTNCVNALTIDVEDYHSIVSRWWFGRPARPTRAVVENTEYILEVLEQYKTKATFFVLGEVAETHPELIKRITASGHELGVHGYEHLWVHSLTRQQFGNEIGRTKKLIEDLTGQQVLGHRAPAFSLNLAMIWAFEVLLEVGFKYDASVHPFKGRRYGDPSAPLEPFRVELPSGSIWEIPPATLEFLGRRWPACGGGYLRHFPYELNRWALRRINRRRPTTIYMHPYEIETTPPRAAAADWSAKKRLRYALFVFLQYRNRKQGKKKLHRLLTDFRFARIIDVHDKCFGQ